MGIKHFFGWFKSNFTKHIVKINKHETLIDKKINIDNLLIDMNGLIHNSAQKIYKYGRFEILRDLPHTFKPHNIKTANKLVFKDVCDNIDRLFTLTNPSKRLILCIDGPAPASKCLQQRSRRFKNSNPPHPSGVVGGANPLPFDQNQITPGTEFMDHLSKYVDRYIRYQMNTNLKWQNIDVIFSNEKARGEGEHKLQTYIRDYGDLSENYCLQGNDADLIMLSLASNTKNFYILRDDVVECNKEKRIPSNFTLEFFLIDINSSRKQLQYELSDGNLIKNDPQSIINDFIFIGFISGNDFLPHIPSIEIIEGGLNIILDIYRDVLRTQGHLTHIVDDKIRFRKRAFGLFMTEIANREKDLFESKINNAVSKTYFKDELLEKHSRKKTIYKNKIPLTLHPVNPLLGSKPKNDENIITFDIDSYREEYMTEKFKETTPYKEVCHHYIEGMMWVITYYLHGVPNWEWKYPYHYAPSAYYLSKHINSFEFVEYGPSMSLTPYQQLLAVLPPSSSNLLPEKLGILLSTELKEFCPDKVEIDLSGMQKEWMGIVLLPIVDFNVIKMVYFEHIRNIEPLEKKRNIQGTSFVYIYDKDNEPYIFKSYYGEITDCKVQTIPISL